MRRNEEGANKAREINKEKEVDDGEYGDSAGEEEVDAERDMIREQHEEVTASRTNLTSMMATGLKAVTGSLLAKAFLPSAVEVKQCLVYTDLAIKMQMIVFDLCSSLWWSTMAELFIFFFALFVFFIDAGRMGFIWMFIPHIARAVIGIILIKKLPTTHEMVAQVSIPPAEKIPFSKISKYVVTGAKESVDIFQKQAGKFLLIYAILTPIALILDMIVMFIGMAGLADGVGAFSTVFILLLGFIYFIVAFYFIGWVISVRMRLPEYAQTHVAMGLLGIFKKLTMALDEKYAEVNPGSATAQAQAQASPSNGAQSAPKLPLGAPKGGVAGERRSK